MNVIFRMLLSMMQRYIIYLERKKDICYYGNNHTFFSILYLLLNKQHAISVIILHKTNNITDTIQKNRQHLPS